MTILNLLKNEENGQPTRCVYCGEPLNEPYLRCTRCESDVGLPFDSPGWRLSRRIAGVLLLPLLFTLGGWLYQGWGARSAARLQVLNDNAKALDEISKAAVALSTLIEFQAVPCAEGDSTPEKCGPELLERWMAMDKAMHELAWRIVVLGPNKDTEFEWAKFEMCYWGGNGAVGARWLLRDALFGKLPKEGITPCRYTDEKPADVEEQRALAAARYHAGEPPLRCCADQPVPAWTKAPGRPEGLVGCVPSQMGESCDKALWAIRAVTTPLKARLDRVLCFLTRDMKDSRRRALGGLDEALASDFASKADLASSSCRYIAPVVERGGAR